MTHDPYRIVPRGVPAGGALVRDVHLQVRTILEYDVTYLRDRVRADLFANGKPLGLYAVAMVDERLRWDHTTAAEQIERFAPDLERAVLGQLSTALTQPSRVDSLEAMAIHLERRIDALSRPWWRRAYDKLGSWMTGVI